jgi:hypothetical protein
MRFLVHAVPAVRILSWLARTRSEGTALDAAAYRNSHAPAGT